MTTFASFGLDPRILSAIERIGYSTPTPIQEQSIPVVIAGRDVMGVAQTGTGKTAGFGLPMIARILPFANNSMSPARHPVRALILTPTRELAVQVGRNLEKYAADTLLRCAVVFGGVDIRAQAEQVRRGVEIVTATPGRLLDLVEQKALNLSQVEIVILDEADRMLDMGFLPDISRILKLMPEKRQSLMFSATFSPEIKKLAQNFLKPDPVLIEVARENQTAETVTQEIYRVTEREKMAALTTLLKTRGPDKTPLKQVIVFVNKKETCRRLSRILERDGIASDAIHGDKSQDDRLVALQNFTQGLTHVLVATDVAARGLDIKELPYVINFDVPTNPEDYVHRIGRTGRAGSEGLAMMITVEDDEKAIQAIEKLTNQTFERKPLEVEFRRRPSRERYQRETEEREDSPEDQKRARDLARSYVPPTHHHFDPIFSRPYMPSRNGGTKKKVDTSLPFNPFGKRNKVVAVLLGGSGVLEEDKNR